MSKINEWRFLPDMPEVGKEVLVAYKLFDIPVQAYWNGHTWAGSREVRDMMIGYCDDAILDCQNEIYAWMQLPEVPAIPEIKPA